MSYDRSGLPGIWTAVRHWVSVVAGAPGPVQAANAAPDVASDPTPTSIGAATIAASEVRKENLANILLPPLGGTTFFMTCAHRPSVCNRRDAPALVTCLLLAGKLLDRPCTRRAPGKIARPKKNACSIRRARSRPRCAGSDPRTFKVWKLDDHKCAFVLESVADELLKELAQPSLPANINRTTTWPEILKRLVTK